MHSSGECHDGVDNPGMDDDDHARGASVRMLGDVRHDSHGMDDATRIEKGMDGSESGSEKIKKINAFTSSFHPS
jgi:hypothetical protein